MGDSDGTAIAKLVLHHADSHTRTINIKLGENVRDWWGDPNAPLNSKGSELAWCGRNAEIDRISQGQSLCIYKSTFANPRPKVTIASIDYVSTIKTVFH